MELSKRTFVYALATEILRSGVLEPACIGMQEQTFHISSHFHSQWHHVVRLKLDMVGVFSPRKLENYRKQDTPPQKKESPPCHRLLTKITYVMITEGRNV